MSASSTDTPPLDPVENPSSTHYGKHVTPSDPSPGSRALSRSKPHFTRRNSGKHHVRANWERDGQDWWFASTAVPLVAATIGPLANVLSIAALVMYWRMDLIPPGGGVPVPEIQGFPFPDPKWCYDCNLASLICGYVGNLFLLMNFTNRVRYIIALPVTIFLWYISAALLMGIELGMNIYQPPIRPDQAYTQGFWHGVIAAVLYLICAMLLMANMLGYWLGHYPQQFNLTDSQRTLILQTMLFFIWLAGGAAIFQRVENSNTTIESVSGTLGWSFSDALYFCSVTLLTVGFGDLYPTDDLGRGIVFPYTVGGTIMLGLMISSISTFAGELSQNNIVKKHVERTRARTVGRTISMGVDVRIPGTNRTFSVSSPFNGRRLTASSLPALERTKTWSEKPGIIGALARTGTVVLNVAPGSRKKPRLIVLEEERDSFNVMRKIEKDTRRFKQWSALGISVCAFGILWAVGAVVFWQAEKNTQGLSYFQALYFCYVSLLTIGYGDLAPKSNAGRPFFVVWSLLAVPTMTILISDMGDTVIQRFKKGTNSIGDFTVLPKYGVWRNFLNNHPWLHQRVQGWSNSRAAKKRLEKGFEVGVNPDVEDASRHIPTLRELAKEPAEMSNHELARKLAHSIKRAAVDCKLDREKKYSYEEWVEITQLIRFSAGKERLKVEEAEEGLIEWDWIGENSPMMAEQTEPEFVLDRLCESMLRYVRNQERSEEGGEGEMKSKRRRDSDEPVREEDGKALFVETSEERRMSRCESTQDKAEFSPPTILGAMIRRSSRRLSDNSDQRL